MARHRPWLKATALVIGAGVLVAVPVSAGLPPTLPAISGYLRVKGPAPLRFQAPPMATPLTLPSLLPAPNEQRAGSTIVSTNVSPPAPAESTNQAVLPAPVISISPDLPAVPQGPMLPPIPLLSEPGSPPSPVVDPALLLEYLAPTGTNATNHARLVWPAFVPPAVVLPPRSSQATYESR